MADIIIQHDNDTWKLLGTGIERDGKLFCHLASTTRFRQQRNGKVPNQIADFIDLGTLKAAGFECNS